MVSTGEMWVLTRTASRSHIVKSIQVHDSQLHRAVTLRHIRDATIQSPSEPFIEIQHEVFTSRGDSKKNSEFQMGFEPTTLGDLVGRSNH